MTGIVDQFLDYTSHRGDVNKDGIVDGKDQAKFISDYNNQVEDNTIFDMDTYNYIENYYGYNFIKEHFDSGKKLNLLYKYLTTNEKLIMIYEKGELRLALFYMLNI